MARPKKIVFLLLTLTPLVLISIAYFITLPDTTFTHQPAENSIMSIAKGFPKLILYFKSWSIQQPTPHMRVAQNLPSRANHASQKNEVYQDRLKTLQNWCRNQKNIRFPSKEKQFFENETTKLLFCHISKVENTNMKKMFMMFWANIEQKLSLDLSRHDVHHNHRSNLKYWYYTDPPLQNYLNYFLCVIPWIGF